MYLKSLTLKGFKSFADRTYMSFDSGLNVVVGPNGSGKSNVSDAILWVLGEQSARMLRGQAMEDVIFSGSSARQPVGLAEVTLVLDNADHRLPVDFNEVGITRRMYRSGESEYLINGSPARLMDIQDILHDTGLGKDTHSIISQGKLDAVLQSRAEDRRELIEEAAGISKHRRRKERSSRKLKAMDENLNRAKDISREIMRQLRPLERQVDKARRAADIQDRLTYLTCSLAVDDLRALQRDWDRLQAQAKEVDAEVELAKYRLDEKSSELERLQVMLEQKGLFVGDLGEQRRRMQDELGRIDSDMRLLEEKGRNMVNKASEMRASLSSIDKQMQDRTAELAEARDEYEKSTASFVQLTGETELLEPEAANAKRELKELDGTIATLAADQRAAQRIADQETLAHVRLSEQVAGADVEDAMFKNRLTQIEEADATRKEALAERLAQREELEESIAHSEAAVTEQAELIARLQQELKSVRAAQDAAQAALAQAKAQLSALQKVEASSADSSPVAKKLAHNQELKQLIAGHLSDFVELASAKDSFGSTPVTLSREELERLIERLLGEDLNALVTTSVPALESLIEEAQNLASSGGSATLVSAEMPTNATQSGALEQEYALASEHGWRLIDALRLSGPHAGLIVALLGNVFVAADVSAALAGHTAAPIATFVTPDGLYVLPDGRCVVGKAQSSADGALERRRQIRELEAQLPELEDALALSEQEAADKNQELQLARETADRARSELASLRGELKSTTTEIGRLEEQGRSSAAERAQLEKQRASAAERTQAAHDELESHRVAAAEAEEKAAVLAEQLEEAEARRQEVALIESQAAAALSEVRLKLATVRERRRHLEGRVGELDRRVKGLVSRRASIESSSRSLEVLRLRIDPLHERYAEIHKLAQGWAARLRDRASLAEADSESLKKTIGDARQEVSAKQAAYDSAKERSSKIELALGKLEVQVQGAIGAITESGSYSLEDALALPEPEDRAADEREVAKLKRQLSDIGPVNQVAMDEYTQLKTRADYISEQVADLEAARSSLIKINAAIDRKMRRQFLLTFDAVNENFIQIFGMLFPGGRAHIEMADPDHPAETGIEIVAQPRGKRITKMTLMSGGEKSLTALALLFAVYRTRTVPFYVFDEVEAALDDSNLDKLLDAIDQLKESTQLIVISHQRRTMEQADVLYGVSMQADGVSHVVSQRLDKTSGKVVDAT